MNASKLIGNTKGTVPGEKSLTTVDFYEVIFPSVWLLLAFPLARGGDRNYSEVNLHKRKKATLVRGEIPRNSDHFRVFNPMS
jgi:hypothetical protein